MSDYLPMAMSSSGRADAIYNAVAALNPTNFAKLSPAEQATFKTQIQAVFGTGDLAYITANAQVNPSSLAALAGIAVATTGSATAQTGATTAPGPLTGLGTVS